MQLLVCQLKYSHWYDKPDVDYLSKLLCTSLNLAISFPLSRPRQTTETKVELVWLVELLWKYWRTRTGKCAAMTELTV